MALAMHEYPHWVEQYQRQAGIASIYAANMYKQMQINVQ
jgi:hypothetical protein